MLQNNPNKNFKSINDINKRTMEDNSSELKSDIINNDVPCTEPVPNAIPLATVRSTLANLTTFKSRIGYEVLGDLPSVHIEQTLSCNDSLTAITSNNRFIIRSPLNKIIFAGCEHSSERDRILWGSARSFQLHLIDEMHQEVLVLRKKFNLGICCCQQRKLEVWMPPGYLVGYIKQQSSLLITQYIIIDDNDNDESPLLYIECDKMLQLNCLSRNHEIYFKIHSGGDLRASIDRKWSSSRAQYSLNIYFSDANLTAKERALILCGAFLMEYLYFQKRF